MINPTWLRSFCTLVELGHFTQTTERLFMTQSGVSQHIQKLEGQLGVLLLDRQGKQFQLTEAGRQLYSRGKQLLDEWQNLATELAQDPADSGLLQLMSPGSVGLRLYPQLLNLQQRSPGLVVDYRFAPNSQIEAALVAGDIALGLMSVIPSDSQLTAQKLAEEPLCLVTPVAAKQPSWQVLSQLGFINHPDGAHHAKLLMTPNYAEFNHIDDFPLRGFSNQIALILEPVSRGLGFTVLPQFAVEAFQQTAALRVHHLEHNVSEPLYLVQHKRRALAARYQMLCEQLPAWL